MGFMIGQYREATSHFQFHTALKFESFSKGLIHQFDVKESISSRYLYKRGSLPCTATSYFGLLHHNLLPTLNADLGRVVPGLIADTLSRSSAEAEYRGVANAVSETSWIRNLLRELHTLLFTTTLVYCDNVGAVYMSANPVQHQRTKHTEIDIHFVRDKVAACHVRVLHVLSRFQYADIFTKGLPYSLFADFRSSLSVRKTPAPTAGAY
ncbi:ribonuclease H-like domain-containing protein [Tanacetum coccineum]